MLANHSSVCPSISCSAEGVFLREERNSYTGKKLGDFRDEL